VRATGELSADPKFESRGEGDTPECPTADPKVVADVKDVTDDTDLERPDADSGDVECAKFGLPISYPSGGLAARRLAIGR